MLGPSTSSLPRCSRRRSQRVSSRCRCGRHATTAAHVPLRPWLWCACSRHHPPSPMQQVAAVGGPTWMRMRCRWTGRSSVVAAATAVQMAPAARAVVEGVVKTATPEIAAVEAAAAPVAEGVAVAEAAVNGASFCAACAATCVRRSGRRQTRRWMRLRDGAWVSGAPCCRPRRRSTIGRARGACLCAWAPPGSARMPSPLATRSPRAGAPRSPRLAGGCSRSSARRASRRRRAASTSSSPPLGAAATGAPRWACWRRRRRRRARW